MYHVTQPSPGQFQLGGDNGRTSIIIIVRNEAEAQISEVRTLGGLDVYGHRKPTKFILSQQQKLLLAPLHRRSSGLRSRGFPSRKLRPSAKLLVTCKC